MKRIGLFCFAMICFLISMSQSPIPANALQLWLRGDDGITKDANNKISAWADQSANGRLASQVVVEQQPLSVPNVINGHAVVRFAPNISDLMKTNYQGPNTNEVTMFVVAQGSNISSVLRFQNELPPTTGYLIYGYTFLGANNGFCMSNDGGDNNGINCGFFQNSNLHIGTARWKANTTNGMQTFLDGQLLAQRNSNVSTLPNDLLQIGTGGSVVESTVGDVAEIIIYDRTLSDAERLQVETYLNIKYRVTNNLASSLPGSGNAISFNGSTQSGNIPNTPAINFGTNDFSLAFWYNSANNGRAELIFEKRDDNCGDGQNWSVRKAADQVYLEINVPGPTSDVVTIPNASDGNWHHIVFTRTATQLSGFKDGMLIATTGAIAQNVNNSAPIQIATGPCSPFFPGGNGFFTGSLDEIQLWNTALTQTQIRDRMCKKITSTDPLYSNLAAYYNFDETTGATVFDGTINANNGSLVNSPTRVTSGAAIGNASSHDYVNAIKTTSLTHPTGENFTVTSTAGNPTGIHVYRVDEQPNIVTGASGVGGNDKYFGVFQVNGTAPQYTAVYNYNGNPFVTPSIESDLRLNKRADNAAASWSLIPGVPDEPNNTITVTGESTEYILGRLTGSLPLNLISFTGSRQSNDVLLQWKTAHEVNLNRFEVQRSDNGIHFVTIGSVTAGAVVYSVTDANSFSGKTVLYYRLKSVNADGRITYSNSIRLSSSPNTALTVYPNPVSDVFTISGLKKNGTVLLYTAGGKLVQQQTVTAQTVTVDMIGYAKGMYLLQYKNDDETVNQKIIKQ